MPLPPLLARIARIRLSLGARKRRHRMPRARFPRGAEQDYLADLLALVKLHRHLVERVLLPELSSIVAQAAGERGDSEITNLRNLASWRSDGWATRVAFLFESLRRTLSPFLSTERLEGMARKAGEAASSSGRRMLQGQLKAAIGVDVIGPEPGLAARLEGFALENVALIRSIPSQLTDGLEQRVLATVQAGGRAEDLAQEIQDRYDVSETRAALIARDQIGKLNGQLNKVRQEALGIPGYTWRTSNDERVRPEHADREGKHFDWDDPPEDGHPGEPINCRCTADPDVEEVLQALEEEDAA